jgi:hypothetical protein
MSAIRNDQTTDPRYGAGADSAWGVHALYGRRLNRVLYLQVPLFVFAEAHVHTRAGVDAPAGYSSFFLTPGLQVRGPADRRWSVFLTAGAGLVRYKLSQRLINGAPIGAPRSSSHGLGYVDVGSDVRVNKRFSIRTGVRGLMARPDFLEERFGISHSGTSTSLLLLARF